jgi:hypothetical protein
MSDLVQQDKLIRSITQQHEDPRGEERHAEVCELLRQILHALSRNGR